jgi:hypothetical protein
VPANAAIYIPSESVDLAKVFPDTKSDIGIFRKKATWFSVPLNGARVTFNVMPAKDVRDHP